jgi:hypothetical protein
VRTAALAAFSAALVSIACLLGWQFFGPFDRSPLPSPGSQSGESLAAINALRTELHELRRELRSLQSAYVSSSSAGEMKPAAWASRLATLEASLEELSSTPPADTGQTQDSIISALAVAPEAAAETAAENQRALAESAFEADNGKPLGDYTATIDTALHAAQGIQVTSTDCRNSICKITYTKSPSATQDSDPELVDRLSQAMPGRDVELLYANDAYGNDVVYIQLR